MLEKILSKKTCAECRVCCSFDNYDIWETPVISDKLKSEIEKIRPEQKFVSHGQSWLFRMDKADSDELFYCPMLTETGCILGNKKPFDCNIWPLRVMNLNGSRVISISPVCKSVFELPMVTLREFAEEVAGEIFAYSDENPDIVKEYDENYPILIVRKNSK